jgi:rod shape-determining protein MreB
MSWIRKLAIDLGTSNCTIWSSSEGILLTEPSVVAMEAESRKVLAAGSEAKKMEGKTPDYIEIVKPIEFGAIVDYEAAVGMLKWFLREIMGSAWLLGPEVMVTVASGLTQVEQRAVLDAMLEAGARKVYLIDTPLAAAIGAKIPISEPFGNMVVNMGGGIIESAVVASGGVVASRCYRGGGSRLDESLEEYLKKKYSLAVGDQTVESIKIKLGTAVKLKKTEILSIGGRDLVYGLPKNVELNSDEVFEVIRPMLDEVILVVRETLQVTPPELVADIADRGIVLVGAASKLRSLALLLTREIGVSVHLSIEPESCVIRGAGMAMENLEIYRKSVR